MKKILSKIFAVALAVCMLLTVAACNPDGESNAGKKALAARETNSWEIY